MEHRAWLWRRKSSERVVTKIEKSDLSAIGNEQEKEKSSELERYIEGLNEQLYSVRTESDAKDNLLAKQKKVAEEAIAGWEKAEIEAETFKKELADALLSKAAAEERIASLDSTLNECMKQLYVSKEEHQDTINDAMEKLSRLEEKAQLLETSLVEKNDNLEAKEKLIEDLIESKSHNEALLTEILARLESSEKDNASLKYEVFMLQKEMEIRNQDRDFHIKSADAAHNKYRDSLKKFNKLEAECQRLRKMLRKRLPGPASIAEMRSEVLRDFVSGNDYDSLSTRVVSLVERVNVVEDENKVLKETLVEKNNEVKSLRSLVEDSSKGQLSLELRRSFSNDLPLASISDYDSEISLMDDFIEMEKLAIVCVDKKPGSSNTQGNPSDIEKPLCKMIQLVEGIIKRSFKSNICRQILDENDENALTEYKSFSPTVFLWELSEPCTVLQNFVVVCNDLLHGKVDFKKFICELVSTLEWTINHCHALQDVPTMKGPLKKLLNADESHEDKEDKAGISNLEAALMPMKNSNRLIEEQLENQKFIAEDPEVELDDKSSPCEKLEPTCLELQLQLESSAATKETAKYDKGQEEKQLLRTDREIAEASEKLAECQATILNLGKQLQTLTAIKSTALFNKVMSPNPQLLNQMQDNDESTPEHLKSPKTKEIICTEIKHPSPEKLKDECSFNEQKDQSDAGKLVIVSRRQKGGISFLKKLLSRRKKESNKKKALPIGS